MNKIKEYLDQVFEPYGAHPSLHDLKEQIYADSMERYQDYVDRGMDEDEACEKVISHLGDLNELLKSVSKEEIKDLVPIQNINQEKETHSNRSFHQKGIVIDEPIHSICLNVVNCDVRFSNCETDCIVIDTNCEFDKMIENGVLTINEKKVDIQDSLLNYFLKHSTNIKMRIEVPNHLESLVLDSKTGDIKAEILSVKRFSVKSYCGDFKGSLKNTEMIRFELKAGDVDLSCSSNQLDLSCQTECGDLKLDLDGLKTARFETNAGDIKMTLHSDFERIQIDSSYGDIKIDASELSGVQLEADTTLGEVVNHAPSCVGKNLILVDTSVGDIKIKS